MASLEDVRRIAMSLPRTSEHLIGDHTKFRVGRLVRARLPVLGIDELREILIDAWCMCVSKKTAASYLQSQGIEPG
jgi:hypothetical protein